MFSKSVAAGVMCALVLSSCSAGAGGSTPTMDAAPAPVLSVASIEPGHVLTVTSDAIRAGEEVPVRVSMGPLDLEVAVVAATDGQLDLVLPPYVDSDTGQPSPVDARLSVASGPAASLRIEELPPSMGSRPGDVMRAVVAQVMADLARGRAALTDVATRDGLDTSAAAASAKAVEANLAAVDVQLDSAGTITLLGGPDGPMALDAEQLDYADRYLTAILEGQLEYLQRAGTSESAGAAGTAALALSRDDRSGVVRAEPAIVRSDVVEQVLAEVRQLRKQVDAGGKALVGQVSMMVTLAAAYLAAGGALGASGAGGLAVTASTGQTALFAFLAAGASIVVLGSAAEGLSALEAYLSGEDWTFGNEINRQLFDAFTSIGLAIGGDLDPRGLVNYGSFLWSEYETIKGLYSLLCTGPKAQEHRDFCTEAEARLNRQEPLAVRHPRMSPEFLAAGVPGTLIFGISPGPSLDISADIDWGDGTTSHVTPAVGYLMESHTYAVGGDDPLNVIVTATDAKGNVSFDSTWVLVAETAKPVVVVGNAPTNLLTRNEYSWTFVASGGVPGYTMSIDWGDGTSTALPPLAEPGPASATHSYAKRGEYVVQATVADEGGEGAQATASAVVHDPVAISDLAGPLALDPDETGTWTVGIEQGWPPYEISVEWTDGTAPFAGTVDGATTVSHAFAEAGSYSITATVTDSTGLSAESIVTVEVPRPPLTFKVTMPTATLELPNGDRSTARANPIKGSIAWAKQTISFDMGTAGVVTGPLAEDGTFRIKFTVPPPPVPGGALAGTSTAVLDGTIKVDAEQWRVTGGSARVRQVWPSGARLLGVGKIS
ncbi:MAG: hypothetical protein GC156_01320 [Actinomycetales bacterium]|nr:hypothetical protein [Actinomycetales bacterium]